MYTTGRNAAMAYGRAAHETGVRLDGSGTLNASARLVGVSWV
jgi:hypothetical protein